MRNKALKFFIYGVIVLGSIFSGELLAQEKFSLVSVVKQDEVNMTRFVLQFSRLPEYQITTSGQRLEVQLMDTSVLAGAVMPSSDERLVQLLLGQSKKKLVLSFLLRRPPYFVNGVKDVEHNRISINVHWQENQRGTRPAIARSMPGEPSIIDNGGVISRSISSKYRGRWLDFFADYEPRVQLTLPVSYTVAPFPCLALFENVDTIVPFEVLTLAQQGEWQAALSALDHVGLEGMQGADKVRLLLIRADIQFRAGKFDAAQRYMKQAGEEVDRLASVDDALASSLDLQLVYWISASSATPYEFSAELDAQEHNYMPQAQLYFDLLQAEVAIAVGDFERSRAALDAGLLLGAGSLEPYYRLRSADLTFLGGDMTGASEQYLSLEEVFSVDPEVTGTLPPFSLANCAVSLYRTERYDGAIEKLRQLIAAMDSNEERDMARYILALALIHHGDRDDGYDLLHQIAAGTVGASLAKAKIADMGMQTVDIYSRRRALQEYAYLSDELVGRELRAEMQFKHALALHILGQNLAAIEELELFLRNDHLSDLRPHAQALLAELLPTAIDDLVATHKYYSALVLVEKNRDLLVATSRDFKFLLKLGQVFTNLDYADSAERLYTYLLDVNDTGERQEQVYAPLLLSLTKQGNYDKVAAYSERYFATYPQGKNIAEVFLLRVQALLAQGKSQEVVTLLQEDTRPQSEAINRLAANLAWERNLVTMARKNIDAVVGDKFSTASPSDQLLQAEIMLLQGELDSALARYRNLDSLADFAAQSSYREASILLQQGQRQSGLKLLQQLVDTGNESQWRTLAQETLKIERLNR